MLCILSAFLAMTQDPSVQTPESKAFQVSFKATRADIVTVAQRITDNWALYQFKNQQFEIELPTKPVAREFTLDELKDRKNLLVDYLASPKLLNISFSIEGIDPAGDSQPWKDFADEEKSIKTFYQDQSVKSQPGPPILGGECRIWQSDDFGTGSQRYFRVLSVSKDRRFRLAVSGHKENEYLQPTFEYILGTVRKTSTDHQSNPPAPDAVPEKHKDDTVTLTESLEDGWATYRFENWNLNLQLPSKPFNYLREAGEPTSANWMMYVSNGQPEYVQIGRGVIPPDFMLKPSAMFKFITSKLKDWEKGTEVKVVDNPVRLAGMESQQWRRIELNSDAGNRPQRSWVQLAIDRNIWYFIVVTGDQSDENLRSMFDRIVKSARKS